ncbi:SMC family ATPase, partial [Streptomyces sp. SID5770]|nr:SMC family ATPase [Streptomyces sp. SID5770]
RGAEAAEGRLAQARERRNDAHETWLDVKSRRLEGIAAELAEALDPGAPCQVCGSTTHPAPARTGAGHVDRAAEDAAYTAYTDAEEARTAVECELAVTRESWTAARAEARTGPDDDPAAADPTVEELAGEVEELTRLHADAHALAGQAHAARQALARAEREHEERVAAQREAERRVAARTSRRETLDRERAALDEEIARGRGAFATVAEHAERLERRIALLADAADTVRSAELADRRLKEADALLADAAYKEGFATPDEAADAFLAERARRELQDRLDAWQAEEAVVADRLAEPATAAAAALP